MRHFVLPLLLLAAAAGTPAQAEVVRVSGSTPQEIISRQAMVSVAESDTVSLSDPSVFITGWTRHTPLSIYALPYSLKTQSHDWHRLWINTAVLSGAYISTLFVLELLPEDATSWNRAELRKAPFYKRWYENVFQKGPEWDHDNPIFNFVLHPYAGAVYFMAARSNGFNFYQSLLYSTIISTVGWEFGIEACMERPSIQDIFITPLVGSAIGEGFYRIKRHIVEHDYTLAGSRILGNIVVFLVDPVNEVVGLFNRNPARDLHLGRKPRYGTTSSLMPAMVGGAPGFTFSCTF